MKNKTCIRIISYMLTVIMLIHTLMGEAMPVRAAQGESIDVQQEIVSDEQQEQVTEISQVVDTHQEIIERTEESLAVSFGDNGVSQYEVLIDSNDKYILYADNQTVAEEYQWQIRHRDNSDLWIDIHDMTNAQCIVSYSLVADMLDMDQKAYIRCIAIVEGIEQSSNLVEVTYSSVPLEQKELRAIGLEDNAVFYSNEAQTYAENPEFVTVTIKYVDKGTQAQVFDDYIATLQFGSDFKAEVPSPTRLGYKPFVLVDGEYQEIDEFKIDLTNIETDVVYKVEYDAVEVAYSARHYTQNVSDNQYSEYRAITGMAKTGTMPTTAHLSLEELVGTDDTEDQYGFTTLYHEPDTVAADGSTEFRVYYDRKYYLYTFDLDGGYGVDPMYARYETPIVVGTPEKPGYEFIGWQKKTQMVHTVM